jgi:energy-coupling factor transporter ATP-binding protein EcfA2
MARVLRKSWHESFFDCVNPHTDAPTNFITWSALSLISAALKNNVYFEIGTYTLYPNMFVVLVAPPGVGKGTAMNLVEMINDEKKPRKIVNTINDRATAEAMIETIATGWIKPPAIVGGQFILGQPDHSCLIFSTELRTLLSASTWMLEFLEEAWSKKTFDYQTKNKGNLYIDNMCCSLLAASVPDFLRNVNREANMVITGGFSSRCLFIYAEQPSKDLPFPEPLKKVARSKAIYDNLVVDLAAISQLRGEFRIEPDAKLMFTQFLVQNRIDADKDDSEAISNFRARVKAHAIKLGMAFSASRGDDLAISKYDMHNALEECRRVIENLRKLFRGAGDSMDASSTARVQAFIEKHGAVTEKDILKALYRHITETDLKRILLILTTIGFCELKEISKKTFYSHVAPTPVKQGVRP